MSETPIRPTDETFAARVADGIKLLDEQFPEWWEKINLDTLDVASGHSCVTAQMYRIYDNEDSSIYGRWTRGAGMLGLDTDDEFDGNGNYSAPSEYILHGFNAEGDSFADSYANEDLTPRPGWEGYEYSDSIRTLNGLWKAEIIRRREAASL